MPKTYDQIHAGLFYVRGKAGDLICSCGEPANDWAYQHNAGEEELLSPSGAPYSENLMLHYAPMCHPCHMRLDFTVGASEKLNAARRRNGSSVGSNPDFFAGRKTNGEHVARTMNERFLSDPEFAEKCREARRKNGNEALVQANALRFRCECGREMSRTNLSRHQVSSRHAGFTDLGVGIPSDAAVAALR